MPTSNLRGRWESLQVTKLLPRTFTWILCCCCFCMYRNDIMPGTRGFHPNGSPNTAQEFDFGPIVSAKVQASDDSQHSPEEELSSGPAKSLTSKDAQIVEFFSQKTFQMVLHNPTTAHQLLRFSNDRLCGENMEFLRKVRCHLRVSPGGSKLTIMLRRTG